MKCYHSNSSFLTRGSRDSCNVHQPDAYEMIFFKVQIITRTNFSARDKRFQEDSESNANKLLYSRFPNKILSMLWLVAGATQIIISQLIGSVKSENAFYLV